MKKKNFFCLIFLVLSLFFVLSQAQEVPVGANKYLQNATPASSGDQDRVNVIFFEIPESIGSSTILYFAVYDPGCDNTPPDSRGTAGILTYYYLIGGSGALSHPDSRLINYSSDTSRARVGTLLSSFTADDTLPYNSGWYYFPNGVRVDQGEKIGSKYYFKVVVELQYSGTLNKNAYKVGVSFSNSGNPTGVTGANAFLYCWTVAFLNNTGTQWDFYPFVPDNATGNIVFRNFDMDNGETLTATNITGTTIVNYPVTKSGDSSLNGLVLYPANPASTFPIGTERGGTWLYRVTENVQGPGDGINTADIFSYNSPDDGTTVNEYYRVYSNHIPKPPTPTYDHVDLSYEDGIAVIGTNPTDTGETVVLQIVDVNNNPVYYSRKVYVYVTGSARIMSSNNGPTENSINASSTVVTTDSTGMGWIKIKDASPETIQVNLLTDGTNGSDNFGDGTDDSVQITFVSDPDPTISSSSNITFTLGAGSTAIPLITVTHLCVTSKLNASNNLYIRIPSTLDCNFDTTVTNPTFGGSASGKVNSTVSYPNSKTILIDITTNFTTGDILTINGLRMRDFNSESSGRLELSFDGGLTYTVVDNKVYSILDTNPPVINLRETYDLDNDGFIDAIKITFSKAINDSTVNSSNFTLTGGVTLNPFSSTTNGDIPNNNVIYLTFTDGVLNSGETPTLTYTPGSLKDLAGNSLGASSASCIDKASPVIFSRDTFDLNGNGYIDAIRITFSEAINDSTVNPSNFDVSGVTGEAFSSTTNADVPNNNIIYITFNDGVLLTDATPLLTYTAGTLTDLAGNPLANSSATVTDTAGPAIISAVASDQTIIIVGIDSDDTVTITFSENTNQPTINATNINSVLQLSDAHSWLDGSGNITSAIWTDLRTLVITLSTTGGLPTVSVGDSIKLDGLTIRDTLNNASSIMPFESVTGTFSAPSTPPVITLTRASVGTNQIYVEFNEAVFTNTLGNPIVPADFYYDSSVSGSGLTIQSIISLDASNTKFIFRLSSNLTERAIVNDKIRAATNASVFNSSKIAMLETISYSISDIGENFFTNVELIIENDPTSRITNFDGSKNIRKETYKIYANIFVNDPAYDVLIPRLAYDFFDDKNSALFWDPETRATDIVINGRNVGGTRWEFTISQSSKMRNGKYLSFVFTVGNLKCYRSKFPTTSPDFNPLYAESYVIRIREILEQNSSVTILNNVINPHKGQKTKLIYTIEKSGPVSIVVYDLNSDVVMVLKNEHQEKGKYIVLWDGKNSSGKIVSRGVYFIRIRAPGIFNQIRKVLVIK